MGKLTYQIEVLTPVHVGNGRQILPPEYVLDSEARKIVRVDLDSLFREKGSYCAVYKCRTAAWILFRKRI